MNHEPEKHDQPWIRLSEAHRQQTDQLDVDAPFGFATRVTAKWQELRKNERFLAWERLSIRTAIGCSICAVVFTALNLFGPAEDPAGEMLIVPPSIGMSDDELMGL